MSAAAVKWIRPVLGLTVTFFFIWLLFRQIDLAEVAAVLLRFSASSLAAALIILAVDYSIRIIRWWWMLRAIDPRISLQSCVWPFLVSIAVNNLIPFRAGDALRVVGFRKQLRAPAMRLFGSLFVERLLDLLTLLGFFFIGLLGVSHWNVPSAFTSLMTWVTGFALIVVFSILLFHKTFERIIHWISAKPKLRNQRWGGALEQHAMHFLDALGVLRTPLLTLQLISLSILVWLMEGAVFLIVAHVVSPGIEAAGAWFALATGTLATLLPSSPGYVGTFDYFAMLGLMAYGTDRTTAAGFAIAVHAILWLPLTLAGIAYFLKPGSYQQRNQVPGQIPDNKESE